MKKPIFRKVFAIASGIIILCCIFNFVFRHSTSKKPNIILITIDALRADHLSCYGYGRMTSPNIDKLAGEGVSFPNCFAVSSYTLGSMPALLTGKYLSIFSTYREALQHDNILDKRFITLAEYLKKYDYFTVAFLNNVHFRNGEGFEQGFDYYSYKEWNAEIITDRVIDFLNEYQDNKPLFVWIHYLDVHAPYRIHEEYFRTFENDSLYKNNDRLVEVRKSGSPNGFASDGYIPPQVFHPDKYNVNHYIACYDSSISYVDFHIGRLLKNIHDNTIIIITADHGESLGEHNVYFDHGSSIYDELLHIPLIIKDNRSFKGGKKILTAVSSLDITPTILSKISPTWYLFNKNKFNGVDLAKIVGSKNLKRRYIYSYFPLAWGIRDIKENIKFILNSNGNEELYFSPDENNNRINDISLKAALATKQLREELETWLKCYPLRADPNPKKRAVNGDLIAIFRTLGYLE